MMAHKICPQCGDKFTCDADKEKCWCFEIPRILSPTKTTSDCLCQKCLSSKVDKMKKKTSCNIFLVRHGNALYPNENPKRPLSEEGVEEVKLLAQKISLQKYAIDKIFHSGILRASQTAEILKTELKLTIEISKAPELLPESNPIIWSDIIAAETQNIMLVGHMPFMSDLVAILCNEYLAFETANLIHVQKDDSQGYKLAWNSATKYNQL